MNTQKYQKLTGILFIVGALLINIPYTLLIMNFEYPDILREPTGYILMQYQMGGTELLLTWFAFAWVGLPILFAILMLQKILNREDTPYLIIGTIAGAIGGIAQIIGILRWTFVVPILARIYSDPNASMSTKETVIIVFQAVHQFGGVLLGEHIGQIFTIIWIVLVSFAILRSPLFKPWLAWLGFVASGVYILAQTELLATVIPNFPVVPEAGLIGSLLWLVWMILLGLFLVRNRRFAVKESSTLLYS